MSVGGGGHYTTRTRRNPQSLKVMEDGSIVLCWRFDSNMLMSVVPGARGTQTYSAVVGSRRDRMLLWRPRGLQLQRRATLLMTRVLLKSVVSHRWYVLMAILDSDTRHRQMSARSPHGPPRVFRIVSLAPHTR